jgi:hypothetical protein
MVAHFLDENGVPSYSLQQCLPDARAHAGRWLCFGIVVVCVRGEGGTWRSDI